MTETEWQTQFLELAHLLGWRHMHVRRSVGKGRKWVTATNVVGWPDLTLYRPADDGQVHLMFVELKTETGKTTAEQDRVLGELARSGCEVHVWRPSDLDEASARLGAHRMRKVAS